jgi:hypothetical protein
VSVEVLPDVERKEQSELIADEFMRRTSRKAAPFEAAVKKHNRPAHPRRAQKKPRDLRKIPKIMGQNGLIGRPGKLTDGLHPTWRKTGLDLAILVTI